MRIFPPYERRRLAAERQTATTTNKRHGRIESRTLTSTNALVGYVDWPEMAQAFQLVRQRTIHDKVTTEVAYGITSMPRELADAKALLRLTRQHWGIENRVFHVRDVTMGEDQCRVRTGSAPIILATFRNIALNLLNEKGVPNKAAALRRHAAHPHEALELIRPQSEN
jgi:predicted transposase YbfD/YdcC